jgi:hypothetical protein
MISVELSELKQRISDKKGITNVPLEIVSEMNDIQDKINSFRHKYGLELYFQMHIRDTISVSLIKD